MSNNREITHTFAWQLDIGKIRSKNEDSVGAAKISQASAENDLSVGIYVVADGVGGKEDGDKASKIAVDTVMKALMSQLGTPWSDEEYRSRLRSAALLAHRQIRFYKEGDRETLTTLVAALVIDKTVHIANVGDSRAYILRDNTLRQITHDHTVAQVLVDTGVLKEEQVRNHRYRHILSQAVGARDPIQADTYTESLQVNDYLLLCSDGLYDAISDEAIVRIITESDSTRNASEKLIKAANDAGGPDNISIVLVQIKAREQAQAATG